MNELRLTKNVKEVQFAGFWGKLKEKKFPETINHKISCKIAHNGQILIFAFQELSSSINKDFILAGGVDTRISFHEV